MPSPPDPETAASADPTTLEELLVTERELWPDGPPHELFKRLRAECPVHWTARITEYPEEAGYWSVTTADDVHEVSHDWADLLLRARRRDGADRRDHAARASAGDVHRHGPAEARPAEDALPARLHAEADRRARGRDPGDHGRRPGRARRPRDVRPGHRRRPAGRLARDRQLHGDPARGRRDLGAADEHHARRGRPRPQPGGRRVGDGARRARDLRALPAADRRAPRAAHRRPDQRPGPRRGGRPAARGARDRDGVLPARRRRQRQHQGDLLQRHARPDGATRSSAGSCSTTRR